MPEIVSKGKIDQKDLRENPLKSLWESFRSLDRFKKIALFIGLSFITFAIYASFNLLETRQRASELGAGRVTISCDSGDYVGCLSSQLNTKIDFSNLEATPSAEQQQQTSKYFFDNLSIPLSYVKYLDMFKTVGGVNIVLADAVNDNGSGPRGALAMVPRTGKIVFYPRFFTRTEKAKKAVVIHETGHIIAGSPEGKRLQNQLYETVYRAGLDSECFNEQGVIKTYAISARLPKHETFAESILNTLVCRPGENCLSIRGPEAQPIFDFPQTCANTYNFLGVNALGFLTPTPSPVPTSTSTPTPSIVTELTPQASGTPSITFTPTVTPTFTPTPTPVIIVDADPMFSPTITVNNLFPLADTYTRSDLSDRNFGTQVYLRAKANNPNIPSYLKFDLRPYAGLNIRKATLRLRISSLTGAESTGILNIKRVRNRTWSETEMTHQNKPAISETVASFRAPTLSTTYEIDLTNWARNNSGRRGSLAIENTSDDLVVFNSKGHSGIKPTLTIEYEEAEEVFNE